MPAADSGVKAPCTRRPSENVTRVNGCDLHSRPMLWVATGSSTLSAMKQTREETQVDQAHQVREETQVDQAHQVARGGAWVRTRAVWLKRPLSSSLT